ncbi:uncharacterized protein At4g00950-like [Primulina eburnea]|uniref:uncharacterized protein At4g00950-like n=1 Tax=Primulina eburnea TaxID=1245227 RepID=UPI003C6C8417
MEGRDERQHSAPNILILTPPNLPLLNIYAPSMNGHSHSPSPRHSGAETPPLQTLASVPFRWEEQPGKPRPCAAVLPEPMKCLELPPCKASKTPSPTAVLDGPYNVGRPKFSSFRYFRDSLDSYSSSPADDAALIGNKRITRQKATGLFGRSLRWKVTGQKENDRDTFGCSPSDDTKKVEIEANTRRNAKSTPLWASIYEGLKHVIPWKSAKKSKKDDHR